MNIPLFRHLKTLQARFLLALILVGIIPFVLAQLILINLESEALTEQSTRELTGLASGFARELDNFLEDVLKDAEAIAGLPDIASMDPARQEPLLVRLHAHYDRHAQLATANLSGQLQAAAVPPPVPIEQVSIAKVKSFQTAANDERQDWWVGPALSNDRRILHMHTPIRDAGGRVVGVLGSPVSLPGLSDVLEQLSVGAGGQAFVLDETGRVLLHPDPVEIEGRRSYAEWIGSPDGGLPPGVGTAMYTLDGETRIAGYAPIPNLGWTVVVDRPEAEVLAPAINSRNLAIGGLIISIVLGLLAAIVLARGLTRPIRELAAAAQAFGAGDTTVPMPENVAYDNEFQTLITAFTAMRKAVVDREAGLRQSEATVRKHLATLEIAASLSERLTAILDLEDLLAEVVNQIKESFDYYHAHIYLLDDRREKLVVAEGTGEAGAEMKRTGHSIPLNAPTSLVARAGRTGEVVRVDNVREAPDWLPNPLLPNTYSEMAVPIILDEQVVGVLDVQDDEIAGLDEGDANLLRSLANQVAVAIRNARLFEQAATALSEAHAAQERYLERSWKQPETRPQRGQYRYSRPDAPILDDAALAEAEQLARTQKQIAIVALNDNESEPESNQEEPNETENPKSVVAPVTLQDKIIGTLQLHPAARNQTWTEDDLAVIEAVVDQLAQSAENLRLFEETRERASREQTIREITDKLRAAPNLDVLLETAARELGQRLGVRHTVLELGTEIGRDSDGLNGQDSIESEVE